MRQDSAVPKYKEVPQAISHGLLQGGAMAFIIKEIFAASSRASIYCTKFSIRRQINRLLQ
jgi:hypothetical protein